MSNTRWYKSGSQWAFWRWTKTPQSEDYVTRLHLIKTPWFAICLHWLNRPDPEPYLHDHPVSFLSLILRGSYEEERGEGRVRVFRSWYNYVRATDRHTIKWVAPRTVTLCFMGPKVRNWGFWVEGKWRYWKDYYHVRLMDLP